MTLREYRPPRVPRLADCCRTAWTYASMTQLRWVDFLHLARPILRPLIQSERNPRGAGTSSFAVVVLYPTVPRREVPAQRRRPDLPCRRSGSACLESTRSARWWPTLLLCASSRDIPVLELNMPQVFDWLVGNRFPCPRPTFPPFRLLDPFSMLAPTFRPSVGGETDWLRRMLAGVRMPSSRPA